MYATTLVSHLCENSQFFYSNLLDIARSFTNCEDTVCGSLNGNLLLSSAFRIPNFNVSLPKMASFVLDIMRLTIDMNRIWR